VPIQTLIGPEIWKSQLSKIKVAVIGTGNIGTDLCERMLRDPNFEVVAVIGRRKDSPGLLKLEGRIQKILYEGAQDLERIISLVDGVFDATSAYTHAEHWQIVNTAGKWMVDLTPSRIGLPIVPELIGYVKGMTLSSEHSNNYSMITCGGQSGAPLAYVLSKHARNISKLEISSSIASLSAGPATRDNIDQYIESTEMLMAQVSGVEKVKAILVLNPAEPPVMMRTTVTLAAETTDVNLMRSDLALIVRNVQKYVPGYELVVEPYAPMPGMVTATAKVSGAGYYLPSYAGNLDIINAAAVQTAKRHMEGSQIHNQENVL